MNIVSTLLILCLISFANCTNPMVQTPYGVIEGIFNTSRLGRCFSSFRGIPFAQPPIGPLRFKEPQPITPWNGILDATKDGPYCIQKNYLQYQKPPVEGQEDCLYLNVYVPTTQEPFISPLPVMVFIHWGAFIAGRSRSDIIGPEYFMDEDIILVTLNYRLGPFGFLSTLDDEAPGNNAFKDQVAALRWVQENILYFGGDKDQITLFGQSAGAGSVHAHILSPLSEGLFHRAISQSGSALALWAQPFNDLSYQSLQLQATLVGCQNATKNSADLIKCLRSIPAEDFLNSLDQIKLIGMDPLTIYTTVVENKTERNPNPFYTKTPLEYIQNGEFKNVPWIIGTIKDEGILRISSLVRQPNQLQTFNEQFSVVFPQMLLLSASVANVTDELNNITNYYFNGKSQFDPSDPKSIQGLIDIYTDRAFAYPSYQSAMLHSAMGHKPIWFYEFDYRGEYTFGDVFAGTNETVDYDWGVCHCDDLLYLFKSPALFSNITNINSDTMITLMVKMWTNFAYYGVPDNNEWPPLNINSFEEMKNENLLHLYISGSTNEGISMELKSGFNKDRMKFWISQSLFENFQGLD